MTVCVALRIKHGNGKVNLVVGADSSACSENEVVATVDPKVFSYGNYTFAFAGDQRIGQVIKHAFIPPDAPDENLNQFMVTVFMKELRACLKQASALAARDLVVPDSEFIVCVGKRLFWVGGDFSVLELHCDMVAIGVGKEYALGSLYSTQDQMTPVERVKTALLAAAEFCPWVVKPFNVIKVR